MTSQETLLAYESLKLQEKEIKEKLDEMKPSVLEIIPEGKEVTTDKGSFVVQLKHKWTYSESVQAAEESLKSMKKDEEAKGLATSEQTKVLVYREAKVKV